METNAITIFSYFKSYAIINVIYVDSEFDDLEIIERDVQLKADD
jgi:hypothetical protein